MGLKEREWGQMGVTITAGTEGWIMLAPAATAYAVLPVGVDTISPSPCTMKRKAIQQQFLYKDEVYRRLVFTPLVILITAGKIA
jgi:hypothetical protein